MNQLFAVRHFNFLFLFLLLQVINRAQTGEDYVIGNLIQFNDNGAWCWYQDERVLIDIINEKLILGADESSSGVGGSPRNGVIFSTIYDLKTGSTTKYQLAKFGCDDHNAPGFLIRPDGKYLAMYAQHYDYYNSRYRIFDGNTWTPEVTFDWTTIPGGIDYTIAYSNIYYLSDENRVYNFARANHRTPNFLVSSDQGDTWSWGGQLTTNTSNSYNKGYYKYWSNDVDRIDFIFTEQHPRDTSTSIYHGYLKNGKAYKSDGSVADEDIFDISFIPAFWDFTKVFADNTVIQGDAMRRCWNTDVVRYDDGVIATIITARINNDQGGGSNSIDPDHSFIYCRYDNSEWSYTYLGEAGKKLYASEQDYTGLAAVHPNDPNRIYISTHIDPRDNIDITKREIFEGVTPDNGATWNWTPITWNSTRDNFRPVVPAWDEDHTALLWLRGTYFSAQSFDAAVVGILADETAASNLMTYVDADLNNTSLSDGSTLVATGPDPNQGADDDQWHQRTGFGNGGSVFTSGETGNGENASALRISITVPQAGRYDVWVNFWANPSADWRIEAGLSDDNMQIFRSMANKQVDENDHKTSIVLTGDGNTFLYQAFLGRVEVGSGKSFNVFVDDESIQTGTSNTSIGNTARTWYDGVSYANSDAIIPVELISLNAYKTGFIIKLKWITATEINNSGFEIERQMIKGEKTEDWSLIAFKEGEGTTTNPVSYLYEDNNIDPSATSARYRLKQIDFNGSFKYSNVVEVIIESPNKFVLDQNYPNPFNPVTNIKFEIPQDNFVTLKVYNLVGEEVAVLVNKEMYADSYAITWNASDVPSGIYLYKLSAGNFSQTKKMILLK